MDILALNALQTALGQHTPYNALFPARPVFAYHQAAAGGYSGMTSVYAAQALTPMRSFYLSGSNYPGHPTGHAVWGQSEVNGTNRNFSGHASEQPKNNNLNPNNGLNGLCTHTNTVCFANLDIDEEHGAVPRYYSQYQDYARYHGVVLGEPGGGRGGVPLYRQGLELGVRNAEIWLSWAGNVASPLIPSGVPWFSWTDLAGLQRHPGGQTTNQGMICYNRVNDTVALMENAGTNAWRLHVFRDLPAKIRPDDAAHLKALLEGAIAGSGGSSYETVDITWQSHGTNEWRYRPRVIYCDDHTVWLVAKEINSSLRLGRIVFDGDGARVFEAVDNRGLTTSYGSDQNGYAATRHMMSDDQTVVAVFTNYYYYLSGFVGYFLKRESAAQGAYCYYSQNDSAYGWSIAPFGGPHFVLDQNANADGSTQRLYGAFLPDTAFTGGGLSVSGNITTVFGYSTGTNYGGSMVVKVKPALFRTTEYKEIHG
ncbi:hypothetical protein [Roseospira visakhapatnamensis]|uniref:Uncharacterized protein n=1 Tax=Roseospira visakhapatnamensis TaxID=390880 RepID=A0A7W6W9U1_9PROT|nr:hypothetical protein [Roseospira visakhapatnamensis]MBB4266299.1 hypothetical protein [Roseospira visakhapatnamensis]